MADDTPENADLRFLAEQQARILRELGEMRGQTAQIPELKIAHAATRTNTGIVKQGVEDISERLQTVEGRLNTIDSRAGPHRKAHRAREGMKGLPH